MTSFQHVYTLDWDCKVTKTIGCFQDYGDTGRILNFTASHGDKKMTQEYCAGLCKNAKFDETAMYGVEYGTQCFCGQAFAPHLNITKEDISDCDKLKCPGNNSESCGDANRLLIYNAHCNRDIKPPNYYTCYPGAVGEQLPFCDHTKSTKDRVQDIISRMTLQEKCQQTNDKMGAVPSIGFNGYNWNTECLHGLGGICLTVDGVTRCPSVFSAPPGLGATFNTSVAESLGRVISDEIRAYQNFHGHRSYQNRPIGLSAWGPNLNIYRDPRWGRNVEVPSEDPYHSGSYGVAYTRGLQWGNDTKYTKAIGALKHYTIYSVESGRGSTYFPIAMQDIEETYLPQFKAPVVEANSLGYMCSYAAFTSPLINSDSLSHPHSEPLCASKFFAQTKMRDEYGFKGYVQSDCGAVNNMHGKEHYAVNETDAAAKALKDGLMNSNCGGGLVNHICDAISEGLATVEDLEARVTRSFTLLMDAGLFDPPSLQTYTTIPFDVINSASAQAASLDAARQSLVLLKNPNGILPLKKGMKLALIGPHATTHVELAGNYFEDIGLGTCAGKQCVPNLQDSINKINGVNVTVVKACSDCKCSKADMAAAIVAAKSADAVVLAMGIDGSIEGEGHDRMDIHLPGQQHDLIQNVINAVPSKKIVLLLFNGGMVTIEELKLAPIAIMECWYPGATGGISVAETLFGDQNRFGKLPFTYYAYNFTQKSDFKNMNMSDGVGRSYKYLKDPSLALWPFAFGLSYTTFSLVLPAPSIPTTLHVVSAESWTNVQIIVTNTGKMTGDEVVFLFHNVSLAHADWMRKMNITHSQVPQKQLIAYKRVTLSPGKSQTVNFNVTAGNLSTVDMNGTRHILPGKHQLIWSRGHGTDQTQHFDIKMNVPRLVISTLAGLIN